MHTWNIKIGFSFVLIVVAAFFMTRIYQTAAMSVAQIVSILLIDRKLIPVLRSIA